MHLLIFFIFSIKRLPFDIFIQHNNINVLWNNNEI